MNQDAKPCPNVVANNARCTCPKVACARHGHCCACVEHHRAMGKTPQCFRN
ncbi:MAG: hypothetical protein LIP77_07450 [Planctomycetes bacterium]|nr:hypothetical protein [Planctomycetota bacterium]